MIIYGIAVKLADGLMKGVWYARVKSRKTRWFTCTHLLSQTWIHHQSILIKFYRKRRLMENFIKESKSGFDFASVSSHTRIVNANRLQVHALAYKTYLIGLDDWRYQQICESNVLIPSV